MNRRRPETPGSREAGFSLIEVLIGAGIFLIVVIGILPLFTRAMIDNTAGNDYTQVSNMAKSGTEEFLAAPFNSAPFTVPAGQTYLETKQLWDKNAQKWIADTGTLPAGVLWRRTTRVRQYGWSDLADDASSPVFDHPLVGGSSTDSVHFKEIEIKVESVATQPGALGVRRQFSMRYMKPY
jgi:type II secretory pathway pseudopilin PulG